MKSLYDKKGDNAYIRSKAQCLLSNSENRDIIYLINISRMLIVYWPITIKFRIYASIPNKPQNHKLIILPLLFAVLVILRLIGLFLATQ